MKRLITSVVMFIVFGLNIVLATPLEPNVVQRFSNIIEHGIYKAA